MSAPAVASVDADAWVEYVSERPLRQEDDPYTKPLPLEARLQAAYLWRTVRKKAKTDQSITQEEVEQTLASWRRWFREASEIQAEPTHTEFVKQTSSQHYGFIALCHVWAKALPPLAVADNPVSVQWVQDTYLHMVMWSCQHTARSRHAWPTRDEWHQLRERVIRCVVAFMDRTGKSIADMLQQMLAQPQPPSVLVPRARDAYLERQDPETYQRYKAKREEERQQQLREGVRPEDLPSLEVAEEAAGWLWRMGLFDIWGEYLQIASIFFYKVGLHHAILTRYPTSVQAPEWTDKTRACAYEWMIRKYSYEQTFETSAQIRDTQWRWCWPLGTELKSFASKTNRHDINPNPLAVMQDALGEDLSAHLIAREHEFKLAAHAARFPKPDDPEWSFFWDALFLVALQTTWKLEYPQCEFLDEYVYLVGDSREAMHRLAMPLYHERETRPFVIEVARCWHVFHPQTRGLVPHASLLDAILTWAHWMHTDWRDKTEDGYDTSFLYPLLFGNKDGR